MLLPFGADAGGRRRVAGLAVGGTAFPWLAWRLGLGPGRRLASLRGELAARLVDGVQGQADILAFGREADLAAAGRGGQPRRPCASSSASSAPPRSAARSRVSAPT